MKNIVLFGLYFVLVCGCKRPPAQVVKTVPKKIEALPSIRNSDPEIGEAMDLEGVSELDALLTDLQLAFGSMKTVRSGESVETNFDPQVFFGFNSTGLTTEAIRSIETLGGIFKKYPRTNIFVAGHADNVGNEKQNLTLSERRASAFANQLERSGIPRNRLTVKGYGSSQPAFPNTSAENRQKNRRITLTVTMAK